MISRLERLSKLRAKAATKKSACTDLATFAKKYEDDFLGFTRLLRIQPKEGGGRIPFKLSPLQVILNAERTPRDIVLKGRQVHVTTLECARDLWWFLTKYGARVIVVVQSQTDGMPFRDVSYKIRLFIDSLREQGVELNFGVEALGEWSLPERDATLRIMQAGASEAAASKKGRAGTVNRLHVSESAFYEQASTTMGALLESIAGPEKGTEIIVESTANGASGWYFEQWNAATEGRNGYTPHFLKWWEHPEYQLALDEGETITPANAAEERLVANRATPQNLKWWRRKVAEKGLDDCLQEYPTDRVTCFLLSGRGFFDRDALSTLKAVDKPLAHHDVRRPGAKGWIRIWHAPEAKQNYVVIADTAEGDGGDASASHVYEFGTGRHMATLWGQFKPHELAVELVRISRAFGTAWVVVERNNHGHAVIEALEHSLAYAARIWRDRDEKFGWLNHEVTRAPALDALEQAIRKGRYKTGCAQTIAELGTFIVSKKGKPEAAPGAHDDLVMCSAIGWDVLRRPVHRRDYSNLPPA